MGISLERVFGRARAQLREAVNDALSSGLEALGDRLQASLHGTRRVGSNAPVETIHGHRLREVIERDRALVASSPAHTDGVSMLEARERIYEAEASCEPANERPSQIPLELDTPFLPSPGFDEALDRPFVTNATQTTARADFQCGEPIRTRTMAKLLAGQGHVGRALSIYDYLLTKTPDDAGLRHEATLLRALES